MKIGDYFLRRNTGSSDCTKEGGKRYEVPCHLSIEEYLNAWIMAARFLPLSSSSSFPLIVSFQAPPPLKFGAHFARLSSAMERTLYLPVWLAAADRKNEILQLIQRGPAKGLIAVTLHEAGSRRGEFKSTEALWKYQNGTESRQIATLIEDINRHIAAAYDRRDLVYSGATVRAIAGQRPVTS
jgi:hypothetical protein